MIGWLVVFPSVASGLRFIGRPPIVLLIQNQTVCIFVRTDG
jgi:hypothetical protein